VANALLIDVGMMKELVIITRWSWHFADKCPTRRILHSQWGRNGPRDSRRDGGVTNLVGWPAPKIGGDAFGRVLVQALADHDRISSHFDHYRAFLGQPRVIAA
jgi:hypothetical protein